ncbi:phospholipase A2 group XV-like [Physella acuta]|uniref:phospholipase A2 group XV-like n=1 Tax=Physella acuta TaxID=109671 RepID=UPI0027DC0F0B|nr:phospholipase A2 group XV-like [Physella acuta]
MSWISTKEQISIFSFVLCFIHVNCAPQYPVILVPGDGGSQLVAKLNKTSVPHYWCTKQTVGYESIWINLEELVPTVIDCFVDNMRLVYDAKTRKTSNSPGVDIRTVDFGNTTPVEWLDPSKTSHYFPFLSYFYPIVNDLVSIGYIRGVSVRGAPFDFRKAPNELDDYYNDMKNLVEDTYKKNNNSKVVIVAHSMGNPVSLYFLNHQPKAWKDQYIQSLVSLAGVWGGAVKPLRLMSSGDSLGVIIVSPSHVRPEQRSMPSTAFLMPSEKFWKPSEVLVMTPKKNYTVVDYKEFFADLNFTDGYEMRKDTENLIGDLTPPEVTVHCLHGSGVETPDMLIFGEGEFPDVYPKVKPGDGDGTVNLRSLLGCLSWQGNQKEPVYHQVIDKAEHMAILQDEAVRKYIMDVVTGKR